MALRSPRVTSPSWFRAERWPSVALCIPGTMPGGGGCVEQDACPTGAVSRSQAVTCTHSHLLCSPGQGLQPAPRWDRRGNQTPRGGSCPPHHGTVSDSQKEHQHRGCQNCTGRQAQDQGLDEHPFSRIDLLIHVRKILEDRVCGVLTQAGTGGSVLPSWLPHTPSASGGTQAHQDRCPAQPRPPAASPADRGGLRGGHHYPRSTKPTSRQFSPIQGGQAAREVTLPGSRVQRSRDVKQAAQLRSALSPLSCTFITNICTACQPPEPTWPHLLA